MTGAGGPTGADPSAGPVEEWTTVALLTVATGFALVGSVNLTLITLGLTLIAGRENRRRRSRRRIRLQLDALPHRVDHIIQRLRSGHSLSSCMDDEPGLDPSGGGADEALDEAIGLIDTTLDTLLTAGGPAIEGLQRLRYTLAGLVQSELRARAESSQALASAGVLCGAPVLFAMLAALIEPDLADLYTRRPAGLVCLGVAITLVYGGWVWMVTVIDASASGSPPRRGGWLATERRRGQARFAHCRDQLAATVDVLAVSLGAGLSLSGAVATVAARGPVPVRPGFEAVIETCRSGHTLTDALAGLPGELGPHYQPLTSALIVSAQGGAPLAVLLQRLADDANQARRLDLEARTRRLPVALLPPLTVCMLPAVLVGVLIPLAVVSLSSLRL